MPFWPFYISLCNIFAITITETFSTIYDIVIVENKTDYVQILTGLPMYTISQFEELSYRLPQKHYDATFAKTLSYSYFY